MESMSNAMNFTFSNHPPSDGTTFGEEIEPGIFTGVFGELQKDNADIIWADLWVKLNRYKHFDFTYPYRIEQVCFMVRIFAELRKLCSFFELLNVTFENYGSFITLLLLQYSKYLHLSACPSQPLPRCAGSW